MARPKKRIRHLQSAAEQKRQLMDPETTVPRHLIEGLDKEDVYEVEPDLMQHVHWESDAGNSDSESEEFNPPNGIYKEKQKREIIGYYRQ